MSSGLSARSATRPVRVLAAVLPLLQSPTPASQTDDRRTRIDRRLQIGQVPADIPRLAARRLKTRHQRREFVRRKKRRCRGLLHTLTVYSILQSSVNHKVKPLSVDRIACLPEGNDSRESVKATRSEFTFTRRKLGSRSRAADLVRNKIDTSPRHEEQLRNPAPLTIAGRNGCRI